jgi:hypothetical protein
MTLISPSSPHIIVDDYASWLQSFHWDLFGTLTFDPGRSLQSPATRRNALNSYLSSLERYYKRRVRCFWVEEKRWPRCGLPAIAPHFHVLLACDRNPMTPLYPRLIWESAAGKADMKVYDPSLNAAGYCAKLLACPNTEYDVVQFASHLRPCERLHGC